MNLLKIMGVSIPLFIVACKNLDQGASIKDIATPVPTPQMAKLNNKSFEELVEGRRVYDTHCIKCHESRLPNTGDLPSWHKKVHSMSEKASLSSYQEESLQSYLEIFSDR